MASSPPSVRLRDISGSEPTVSAAFSAFTKWQKKWIVFLAAFAGWFSTLSSFIFFPVIGTIAHDLGTSTQNINLTVTSYLIFAAIGPAVVGILADNAGRRPAYVLCLIVYATANVGLALQKSFPVLFVLRMLQSSGVAGIWGQPSHSVFVSNQNNRHFLHCIRCRG